jgi:membrane protease YdiL (CAAX protease family)
MINTPYKQLEKGDNQIHPWLQFLTFTGLFIGVLIVGNIIGAAIVTLIYGLKTLMALASLDLSAPHLISALWILQISGTTLPIFVAPVIFSYVIVRDPGDYIKPSFNFPWGLLFLVLLIMLISNPLIEILSNINQKLQLPHFLNGVQKWMEDSEKSAEKITDTILKMNTIWDMLLNLFLIGLLTAIVEEFMFRGVLQTIFTRWMKNTHAAIWITAILFSAFHMEFFGFLPRLMLGVLFGYFVVWSGSIWTSVWAHFLNNGTAVVVTYLFQHKVIKISPDDQHVFNYTAYIFSAAVLLTLLFIYRRIALEKHKIPVE